ncbi:MAG TPA: hypothetical protein VNO30_02725 [Kofleriaceae bacterium]|nr:hypothetical protein [Kofleriaceae bacterium]
MADTPRLDKVTPASALPGAQLTLTGAAFDEQTAESAVRFRLPTPHVVPVTGAIVGWEPTTILVQVPALESFGSGGPLEVTVHTAAGVSLPVEIILHEAERPTIAKVVPARGLENARITITGSRFGRPSNGSEVLFQAPGPSDELVDVTAYVASWSPTLIEVDVPLLESLGGPGERSLVVRTPWGRSDPADFRLGELPTITGVVPSGPSAGATITVLGTGFGKQPASLKLIAAGQPEIAPTILSWKDTEIKARLPGLRTLRRTGLWDLAVRTEWGECRMQILIDNLAAITSWTRVEPHARTDDLQAGLGLGLQAQVYDALWLLGRQWQLLELTGQDAGSPVRVQVEGTCTPLARWQPEGGQPEDVAASVPLEAMVERERDFPPPGAAGPFDDLRFAAEAGLQLLRMIDAQLRDPQKSNDYRRRFLRDYPLELPPADTASLDARSRRFLSVASRRVPDGARIYANFQVALGTPPKLPHKPPIEGNDRAAVLAAVRAWYGWCGELFSQATPGQRAWDPRRMEYAFSAGSGELVLDAREHDGGHLDWYSFVRRAPAAPGAPAPTLGSPAAGRGPAPFTRTAIPTPISYPGMPVPRWWELEDRRVDFGAVASAPNELLKLVLVELATVYGNDWFTLPLDALPVGSLCELTKVTVTDTFGGTIELGPFGDGSGTDWRMFELASDDGAADAGHALLLLDALPATLESGPVEEVLLLRDELANLAWAVEKIVESRTGRPFDRHEDEVSRRAQPAPPEAAAARRYLLQTTVPRNWIPLIPQRDTGADGWVILRRLARGAMRDPAGGPSILPLGRLLEPGRPLDIYDEELPPTGLRVTRLWTLGRAANGRTHLWRARRKGPGRGEASSGLRFDLTRTERPDQP